MKNEKAQRGITLVALVITIIILLILAGISINAIVGENGLIERAKESRILTLLSDIVFNIESNIVDINTDNIVKGKKATATEMMDLLQSRDVLKDLDNAQPGSSILMQNDINDNRLENLSLSFNGDIWLDNYKRGKIQLSTQNDVLYSQDGRTKITVIDGTVEELKDNYKYYLHSLKDRDDFAFWINQYGEIISDYKDTIIYINVPREEEYTAIYSNDLKEMNYLDLISYYDYENWYLYNQDFEFLTDSGMKGVQSILKKDENNNDIYIEAQATHNKYSYLFHDEEIETNRNGKINFGTYTPMMFICLSDDYNKLMLNSDGSINGMIKDEEENTEFDNLVVIPFYSFDEFFADEEESYDLNNDNLNESENEDNYEIDGDFGKALWEYGVFFSIGNYIDGAQLPCGYDEELDLYFPTIFNEDDEKYYSEIDFISINLSKYDLEYSGELNNYIQNMKNNNSTRLYYRLASISQMLYPSWGDENDVENGSLWFISDEDESTEYWLFESAIKYIDL